MRQKMFEHDTLFLVLQIFQFFIRFDHSKSFRLSYVGQWKAGQRDGKGQFTVDGELCYEGDYVNGKMHGEGKRYGANGCCYTGEFRDDQMHGKDTRKICDLERYDEVDGMEI